MRTWDEKVVLISSNGYEEDEIGQQVPIETEQEIWCCKEQVSRNEFYLCWTEQHGNFRDFNRASL